MADIENNPIYEHTYAAGHIELRTPDQVKTFIDAQNAHTDSLAFDRELYLQKSNRLERQNKELTMEVDRLTAENKRLAENQVENVLDFEQRTLKKRVEELEETLERNRASTKTVRASFRANLRRLGYAMKWLAAYESAAEELRKQGVVPRIRTPNVPYPELVTELEKKAAAE